MFGLFHGFDGDCEPALCVRSRAPGDEIRLSGGTKSIKKLMIDRKISAHERGRIPILADTAGVIWAGQLGPNLARLSETPNCYILVERTGEI